MYLGFLKRLRLCYPSNRAWLAVFDLVPALKVPTMYVGRLGLKNFDKAMETNEGLYEAPVVKLSKADFGTPSQQMALVERKVGFWLKCSSYASSTIHPYLRMHM